MINKEPKNWSLSFGENYEEIHIADGFELQDENGNVFNAKRFLVVKKQVKYPTTYEECCKVLNFTPYYNVAYDYYRGEELGALYHLLICRDAYWKIAGDWEPDWSIYVHKFCIGTDKGKIREECVTTGNRILAFPTEEMRDTFYENFKELIEECKELL